MRGDSSRTPLQRRLAFARIIAQRGPALRRGVRHCEWSSKRLTMGIPLLVLVGIIIRATGPRFDGGAIFPVATGYVDAKVGLRGIGQVESAPTTIGGTIIVPVLLFSRARWWPLKASKNCCSELHVWLLARRRANNTQRGLHGAFMSGTAKAHD